MKKLVFFLMLFLTSTLIQAQGTTYGGIFDPSTTSGLNPSPTCTYFGTDAGDSNTTGTKNTFIGMNTGQDNTTGRENTFIGTAAGGDNQEGRWNVFVGAAAGRSNIGNVAHRNTYIGYRAGFSNLTGALNVSLGNEAGFLNTGTGNVFIGNEAGYNETGNDQLYIANNRNRTLIHGDFAAETLTFNGEVRVNGDIPPTSIMPPDGIQLFLDGRFAQLSAGDIGAFTIGNRWSSIGNSFIPGNPNPIIYGMLSQGFEATLISGSKSDGNNIIGWSGNRLDFDIVDMVNPTMPTTVMSINNQGGIVIGDPDVVWTPNGYRLYVEEGILTERVKVAQVNSVDWADYVFDEDYERNSTEEVERFVKANKHLPNVPSAKEVSENGVDMVEMDATLLRQIEELWLHVIDLKKENEALKSEVETLRK